MRGSVSTDSTESGIFLPFCFPLGGRGIGCGIVESKPFFGTIVDVVQFR